MTKEEFEDLITNYGKDIYSFCRYLTGNSIMDADELYQETMLRAMESCSRLSGTETSKNFLIGIAIRHYRNQKKKLSRRMRIAPIRESAEDEDFEFPDTALTPEEQVLKEELRKRVRAEVDRLDEKLRNVVYLYYAMEQSVDEISKLLHIPKGTVKSRLHRARSILRERLEENAI